MPIEGSGYVAVEMREVSKLAKVENLGGPPWFIVEAHDDRIQLGPQSNDRLSNGVTLSASAHCSVR